MALGDAIQDNRPIRAGRDTPDPLQEAQCRHIGGRRGRGTVVARTCRQSADQPAEGREDGQCGRIPDVRLQTMPPGSTMVLVVLAIGFPVAWSGTSSPTPPLVVQGSPPSPGFIARTAGCLSSAPCLPDVDRAPIGVVPDDDDAISDLIEEYGRGVDPPECPISMLDLDAEPVVASDGHTYRLSTLMDWCARFSRGRCLSPISQVPIRAEVYYNQDLEMVATSWSDQVRWWRHGVTLPWVQRFNASKAMICADGRSYTVAEVGAYHLITACYVNLALAEAAAKIAELGTFSTDQQEILRPAAERMAQRCPMMRALSPRRQTSH